MNTSNFADDTAQILAGVSYFHRLRHLVKTLDWQAAARLVDSFCARRSAHGGEMKRRQPQVHPGGIGRARHESLNM